LRTRRHDTKERYSREIEDAIGKAWFSRSRATVTAEDGTEAYAYPKPEGRIAWGVNAPETGVNILRGIRGEVTMVRKRNRPSREAWKEQAITCWPDAERIGPDRGLCDAG
jgi:hypothetical protein